MIFEVDILYFRS